MYGNTLGTGAGGLTTAALAYTGTGSLVVPIIVASAAIVLGTLLAIRARRIAIASE